MKLFSIGDATTAGITLDLRKLSMSSMLSIISSECKSLNFEILGRGSIFGISLQTQSLILLRFGILAKAEVSVVRYKFG